MSPADLFPDRGYPGGARALDARGVVFIAAPHLIHRHDDGTEEKMAFFEDIDWRPLGIMAQAPLQG